MYAIVKVIINFVKAVEEQREESFLGQVPYLPSSFANSNRRFFLNLSEVTRWTLATFHTELQWYLLSPSPALQGHVHWLWFCSTQSVATFGRLIIFMHIGFCDEWE